MSIVGALVFVAGLALGFAVGLRRLRERPITRTVVEHDYDEWLREQWPQR